MYFDILSSDELYQQATKVHHLDPTRIPKHIDFISSTGDLTIINKKFDNIFSRVLTKE